MQKTFDAAQAGLYLIDLSLAVGEGRVMSVRRRYNHYMEEWRSSRGIIKKDVVLRTIVKK